MVVLDINLGGESGLETFRRVHELDPKVPVIFITGHGTADTAIEAMRLGAYEYLLKPLELGHLTDLVERAFEISRLMRVPATIPEADEPEGPFDALVGRSPAMRSRPSGTSSSTRAGSGSGPMPTRCPNPALVQPLFHE